MAVLYIEEYAELADSASGAQTPVPGALVTSQTLSVSGTSAQSSALNSRTKFVCLTGDVAVHWTYGSSPTATTSSPYLPADTPRFFKVSSSHKIASRTTA